MWAKAGSQRGPDYTVSEGAKSQSLCVPAHACTSACLAGFHPQLAPTCLPRAGTQQPQARSRRPQKALTGAGVLTGPSPYVPSTTHLAFTRLSWTETVSWGKGQFLASLQASPIHRIDYNHTESSSLYLPKARSRQ